MLKVDHYHHQQQTYLVKLVEVLVHTTSIEDRALRALAEEELHDGGGGDGEAGTMTVSPVPAAAAAVAPVLLLFVLSVFKQSSSGVEWRLKSESELKQLDEAACVVKQESSGCWWW